MQHIIYLFIYTVFGGGKGREGKRKEGKSKKGKLFQPFDCPREKEKL